MAKVIIEQYKSDLSGAEIKDTETPTFEFGLDGEWFHIDLTPKEQEQARKLLTPYLEKATKVDLKPSRVSAVGRKPRNPETPSLPEGVSRAEAREVLEGLGWTDIPSAGRLRIELIEAYNNKTPAPKA